jgi:hypothetical protein
MPLLSPTPYSPTSHRSFAPSAKPPRPLSRSAPREQRAPPPPVLDCCPFCGHRRVCAPSRATVSSASPSAARDTLRCALPLSGSSGPRSPEQFLRSQSPAVVAPSYPCASALLRDPSTSPQGEQPARTLILVVTTLLLARLLTGAVPRRH